MQAIILAAGMGKRLGALTKNNTKCMIEVNGVTLIDRMLTQLSALDLRRVVIVVGYEGRKLMDHIGDRYDDRLRIEYVENPVYDRTNNIYSLALAKEKLEEDDTLLLESDLIVEDSLLKMAVENPSPNIALVAKYQTWMDGTMVRIGSDNKILNFVPKNGFRYEDVQHYYKTVNIYKFSREFSCNEYIPFLEAYSKVMGNNEYYEQVLRILTSLDNIDLKALPIGDCKWYEIDDVQDLDIAENIFASDEDKLQKYQKRYGGYWRFPDMLDFCYLVNPFFPTARMKDEMRANFDVVLVNYPSGMGVNSLLAGKYFGISSSHVCVGNGAAELIKSLMEMSSPGRVGVTYPTFEEYPNRLPSDSVVKFVPENQDFSYTAQDLKSFFADKDLDTLLLVNPDNPSGNYIPLSDVLDLEDWCAERGIRLVVDESFVDFSEGFENNSLLHDHVLESHPRMVVMKSISKSYGVPGLRLGVLASADKELIASMKKDVAIWNINSFAEFYMQIFGKYEKQYFEACRLFIAERERFRSRLDTVPFLRVIPSQANYFLCEVLAPMTSEALTASLLKDFNILIKDCSTKKGFDGRSFIRIAVRSAEDNDRLVDSMASYIR